MGNVILRLLYGEGCLRIGRCDGMQTFSNSGVFNFAISEKVKKISFTPKRTEEVFLSVYEMSRNATYPEIFCSLLEGDGKLKKLCLTQHQISDFCKNNFEFLRKESYGTFFLTKSQNGKFFVAHVKVFDTALTLSLEHLSRSRMWHSSHARRVVIPVQQPSWLLKDSVLI